MGVAVVGSVALDTVETPWGANEEGLGGAATYFSLAASNYVPVHLVGIVGDDFPEEHVALLRGRGIDLEGLERVEGKTFRWSGRYHEDVNLRDTLRTELNVFEGFHPKLPESARRAEYLFLANIHPALQLEVLEMAKPKFIGLDTMNLWINIAIEELKAVLGRVDLIVINDSEVRDLTREPNIVKGVHAIREMGPRTIIVKKGEHGCLLFHEREIFAVPAYPLVDLVDPTGAGDSFAGGFMGYVASQDSTDFATLCQAVVHGTAVASFTCQAFGPDRLAAVNTEQINERLEAIRKLTRF